MAAYQGQNISFTCNYPLEYKTFYKYLYKEDSDNLVKDIRAIAMDFPKGRLSVSYQGNTDVLSVNISNVRKADGGVYLCGMKNRDQSELYYSFFPEICVHVTGKTFIHAVKKMNSVHASAILTGIEC